MISEVVMPQMGADMTEGTLLKWLKAEGDTVARGDVIAEIETDKANVEIEAFDGGVFRRALAQEGDTIQVGEVIAVIAAAEDDIAKYSDGAATPTATDAPATRIAAAETKATAAPAEPTTAAAAPAGEQPPVPPPPPSVRPPQPTTQSAAPAPQGQERIRVSPLARRMAEANGVDLRTLKGSGPDGRIMKKDVESAGGVRSAKAATTGAATRPATVPAAGDTTVTPTKMRQAIARRMAQSKQQAPHYYLLVDIDMTEAMSLRAHINETLEETERVSVNDLIVRACALALQRHPAFNATIAGEQVTRHGAQNVCIAVALDDGLIAPAILDAGAKSLADIARDAKDLSNRAKNGALKPSEISDGTFTITNLGAFGIETLIGIIQPPQTAILGTGTVLSLPAVRDGAIVARQIMKAALSADHRVTDGAQGAQFLGEIKRLLEKPLSLVL